MDVERNIVFLGEDFWLFVASLLNRYRENGRNGRMNQAVPAPLLNEIHSELSLHDRVKTGVGKSIRPHDGSGYPLSWLPRR